MTGIPPARQATHGHRLHPPMPLMTGNTRLAPIPTERVVNRLLSTLARREERRVLADCRLVELASGEALETAGERIRHVYFPIGAFATLSKPVDASTGLAVGLVGDEGMLGITLLLGIQVSPLHTVVQGAGPALRMDRATFLAQLAVNPGLVRILKRYVHVLLEQLAQAAVCSRFHVVEERLARLLILTQDRARSRALHLTQQVLASGLGVRRAGVTLAAHDLASRRLISYRRGQISILDRGGLESAACACYAADNAAYARHMGQ